MDFITVYKAADAAEADVIRSRLEAADFHPFMPDEFTASGGGSMAVGIGEIRVQVPEAEAAEATEFLKTPTE